MKKPDFLHVRVDPEEKQRWAEQCRKRGFSKLSEYVRYLLRRDEEKK